MIRLQNVMTKWEKLEVGEVLSLRGENPRRVRIEFNCPAAARLDLVVQPSVDVTADDVGIVFLAVVHGYEVVEFSVPGPCHIAVTSEDEVWFYTSDGDDSPQLFGVETVSFTKIMNRRARNPQLEMMMFRAEQNMNRRLAMLEAEAAEWRRVRGTDPDTGEVLESETEGDADDAASEADTGANADGDAKPDGSVQASAAKPSRKGAKSDASAGT